MSGWLCDSGAWGRAGGASWWCCCCCLDWGGGSPRASVSLCGEPGQGGGGGRGAPPGAASGPVEAAPGHRQHPPPLFQAPACRLNQRRVCVRVCGQGKGPPAPCARQQDLPEGPGRGLSAGMRGTEQVCAGGLSAGVGAARPQHLCGSRGRNGNLPGGDAAARRGALRARGGARCPRRGVPALSNAAGWRRAGKVNRKRAELVAAGDSQVTPGNRGARASLAGLAAPAAVPPPARLRCLPRECGAAGVPRYTGWEGVRGYGMGRGWGGAAWGAFPGVPFLSLFPPKAVLPQWWLCPGAALGSAGTPVSPRQSEEAHSTWGSTEGEEGNKGDPTARCPQLGFPYGHWDIWGFSISTQALGPMAIASSIPSDGSPMPRASEHLRVCGDASYKELCSLPPPSPMCWFLPPPGIWCLGGLRAQD